MWEWLLGLNNPWLIKMILHMWSQWLYIHSRNGGNQDQVEGTNRTGTYVVKVRLHSEVPELLPISGRRVRISYPGIKIMCTKCFGNHHKTRCQSTKQKFKDYVIYFSRMNPDFPDTIYGRWLELIRAAAPRNVPEDRHVPPVVPAQAVPVQPVIQVLPVLPVLPNLPVLPVQSPTAATADWIQSQQMLQQLEDVISIIYLIQILWYYIQLHLTCQ